MSQASSRRRSMPGAVSIGGLSKPNLLAALGEHKVQLNQGAEALFADPRFTTLRQRRLVEIAAVSVAELGFGEGTTYEQIILRALESGLVQCPLELGPHLRLQFLDQPDSADGLPLTHGRAPPGSLTIASSPLDSKDETAKGFYLRHVDTVRWLRGYVSSPGHMWSPEDVFVFSKGTSA